MKTVVGIITVFVVLNFAVAGSAPAQITTVETQLDEIILEAPIQRMSIPNIVQELYPPKSSYAEAVLVVPSAQMKPEDLLAIMEDMNIMARIFDKQLAKVHLIQSRESIRFYRQLESTQSKGTLNNLFSKREGLATETIYLEDFGAIFLMKVDFPLVPPPKVGEKKTDESADRIWAQTKQEIYMPDAVKKSKGAPPTEAYNAEKVEKLKRTLISALKHASNIRALKQDQWAILTVTGGVARQPDTVFDSLLLEDYKLYKSGSGVTKTGSSLPAVLTICAKKSDIDAFAKGEMDFDQFRQRTKIYTTFAKFGRESLSVGPQVIM